MTLLNINLIYSHIYLFSLILGLYLFPENIDIMKVLLVFVLIGHHCGGWYGWLCYFVLEHGPVELGLVEVTEALVRQPIAYAYVHTCGWQYSVYLTQHLISIWPWTITTENWVEGAFINDSIEGAIIILQTAYIHLFKWQIWYLFFVHFLHLLDNCEWNIYVCYVLVAVLIHLLTQSY